MKINFSLMSIVLISAASFTGLVRAADKDPVLTEKSSETFDLDLNGLSLSLPIELKERATPKKISDRQTDLSIGNIDISYTQVDQKTNDSKTVSGWVEFEGGKFQCESAAQIKRMMNQIVKSERDEFKVRRFKKENFNGYLVTSSHVFKGKLSGVDLQVMNAKSSDCYYVSLAVNGFDGFTSSEIKVALSPLTDAIKQSFIAHANQ